MGTGTPPLTVAISGPFNVSCLTRVQSPFASVLPSPSSLALMPVMPPRSYPAGLWLDDRPLEPPTPPYSPVADSSEYVFTPPTSASISNSDSGSAFNADPLWSSAASFVYPSSLVNVSLGRRLWNPRRPVYGFNGTVQGGVRLGEKCTHVVRVEVSLLGRVTVTTSERGLMSALINRNLVTSSVVISSPPRGGFTPTGECLPFSIPFPSYASGSTATLPPSFASWSPTSSSDVEYCIRVDVHRKGLRRHETRLIPIMYFPKTWPSHSIPTPQRLLSDSNAYQTVSLPPVLPDTICPKAKSTIPKVELSYPSGVTYSSGSSFPLKLAIQSMEAPALAQLLIRGLEAHLIKRIIARSPGGQVIAGREMIFNLTLGECGKEQSWGIDDVMEVAVSLRSAVRFVKPTDRSVEQYKHLSRIAVATEPMGGARDRGLLGFGGFSDPAIGMSDERLEQRPPSSVAWSR
ncbi:hypothetical protein F5148DRAFT_1236571 [Russula earlei]|uniref:Uncharacterized protein n=1 Tax=Russula earlei TaxID=71964 RepID=A0ACC0TYM6_9AGAM|nr:hypothetical protein F5148DRAFT_1236571 [Russula earlei]